VLRVFTSVMLVFSAPVASHDVQKRTDRQNMDVLSDPLRQGAESDRGCGELQNRVKQRATQREAGGWASAGRMPSSRERNDTGNRTWILRLEGESHKPQDDRLLVPYLASQLTNCRPV